MALIILLIVIGLQRYVSLGENMPRANSFKRYLSWLQTLLGKRSFWASIGGVIIIVLPVFLIVSFFEYLLSFRLLEIFKFLFELLVLWYCLDAYPLKNQLMDPFAETKPDQTATNLQPQDEKFLQNPLAPSAVGGSGAVERAITKEIFLRSNNKIFGVLFWYIIIGPVGAAVFYCIQSLYQYATEPNSEFIELAEPSQQILGVLNWLPVRAVGISYALMGHFMTGFNYCRKHILAGIEQTQEYGIQSGFAALDIEQVDVIHADNEENQAAFALVDRTIIFWVVVVAIFTLGGWI